MFYLKVIIIHLIKKAKREQNELQNENLLLRFGKPYWEDAYKSDDMVDINHCSERGND